MAGHVDGWVWVGANLPSVHGSARPSALLPTNLPDLAREVKVLAALMGDKGVEGNDLMTAAKTLRGSLSDMPTSAAPQITEASSDPGC